MMWRFLPPRNFIFFPKDWLIRTGLDKKFVEFAYVLRAKNRTSFAKKAS
ncbi:hypothetical protein CMALT430_390038 [Carnobacterium maltaromaticum]|nr:hypothetical protein CMALT430_390038 [Carnobacterium maltaromaticum]